MKKLLAAALFILSFLPSMANAQNFNWQGNPVENINGTTIFNKGKKYYMKTVQREVPLSQAHKNMLRSMKEAELVVLAPVSPVYDRNPIQKLDGAFRSVRFLDLDNRAAELYSVSGAAINSYTYKSMVKRNSLERQLDAERVNMGLRHYYYLHNNTPWLPSVGSRKVVIN